MKRVVDGVTYNTDTSTMIATSDWEEDDARPKTDITVTQILYQTRGGAFFLLTNRSWREFDPEQGIYLAPGREEITAITREKAQGWLLNGQVTIHDTTVFGEPPEAEAEEKPAATIYLRVPATLKARCEESAQKDGLSLNAWMLRCAENCLGTSPRYKII